uniref:Uncharacterized protein n=1 Tax=uncultured marine virus TaxID=186617 RepID=A0A0F7L6N8_9VIRU|nr:hypothetical protein [uncultured marine virus]
MICDQEPLCLEAAQHIHDPALHAILSVREHGSLSQHLQPFLLVEPFDGLSGVLGGVCGVLKPIMGPRNWYPLPPCPD